MARHIDQGRIEGIDFSETMVTLAEKRNRIHITTGKVRIVQGDFDDIPLEHGAYDVVCSINTIYFWRQPDATAKKIFDILKPTGKLVVAVEDRAQLQKRNLDDNIFHVYALTDIKKLFSGAGFRHDITVTSRTSGASFFHCIVAVK
jgi:SAM-dependent methyltransferase